LAVVLFSRAAAFVFPSSIFRISSAVASAHGRSIPYIDVMAKLTPKKSQAKVLSSRISYQGPVFSVTTDEVEEPGGVRARRDVIRHPGSIVVLAIDRVATAVKPKGKPEPFVLLEHQYRHAAQSMMWELPAGRIDDRETPLTAAKRELLEETGYTARRWKKILHFYVSPGFLDETMTIYLAEELKAGKAQPEPDERIAVRFFPLSEALQMALKGRIRDAKTISGILWLAQTAR
jgi:ADP-ribose pyrophosphatase